MPFGYRVSSDGVQLEPDTGELLVLGEIRKLTAAGMTTRQIASELNRSGFSTRRGTPWRFQYVAKAMKGTMPSAVLRDAA